RDATRAWARIHDSAFRATRSPFANWNRLHTGLAIAALVCLSLGAAALGSSFRGQDLRYEVAGGEVTGGLIRAERGEALVSFTDESSLRVEKTSRLSVDVVGQHAALTRLMSGKLHVKVQHHDDTSYRFLAGPYEVRVIGTEFDLAWDPTASGFSLTMQHGEVRVVSPDGKVRSLVGGEALHLPAQDSVVSSVAAVAAPLPAAAEQVADARDVASAARVTAPSASHARAPSTSWDA